LHDNPKCDNHPPVTFKLKAQWKIINKQGGAGKVQVYKYCTVSKANAHDLTSTRALSPTGASAKMFDCPAFK